MTGDDKMVNMLHNKRWIPLFSPTTILCIALLVAIPLGWFLPTSWGQENGPVENTQVVVILLTALVAYRAYRCGEGSKETKRIFLWSIPMIFIVVARELSWGRVFYPDGHGGFMPLRALWFGQYVYPAIGIIITAVIVGMYLQRLDKEIIHWAKNGKFPIIDMIIIVGSFISADLVEHHSSGRFGAYHEVFEELFELVMYCGVLSLFSNLGFNKLFSPCAKTDKPILVSINHLSSK